MFNTKVLSNVSSTNYLCVCVCLSVSYLPNYSTSFSQLEAESYTFFLFHVSIVLATISCLEDTLFIIVF